MKKSEILSVILVILVLASAFTLTVSAETIPVNKSSSEFWVDIQQDIGDNNNVKENVFDGDPTTRWAGNVNGDLDGSTGDYSGEPGNQSINIVCPFDKEYIVTDFDIQWFINAPRTFYMNVFVSNDNVTWSPAELTGDVSKASFTHEATMISPMDCYETIDLYPIDGVDASPVINVKLVNPVVAKYVKITQYGNRNPETDAQSTWVSIVELSFNGTEAASPVALEAPATETAVTAPEAIPEPEAPVPTPAQTSTTTAPRTADPITIIALGSIISAAGAVIVKKRK